MREQEQPNDLKRAQEIIAELRGLVGQRAGQIEQLEKQVE
jgi:hypothetical protein